MSQLLPYLFLGLLLSAVLAWWVWDAIVHRGAPEVLALRQHRSSVRSIGLQRDLGERIFGTEDWDFVSRETPTACHCLASAHSFASLTSHACTCDSGAAERRSQARDGDETCHELRFVSRSLQLFNRLGLAS